MTKDPVEEPVVEEDDEEYLVINREYALEQAAELLSFVAMEAFERKDLGTMIDAAAQWRLLAGSFEGDMQPAVEARVTGFHIGDNSGN